MLDDARRQIAAQLSPLAKKLNSATDDFTAELKALEADLAKLAVGLPVTLETPLLVGDLQESSADEASDIGFPPARWRWNSYLGYGRAESGHWRILVVTNLDYEDGDENITRSIPKETLPLLEASRQLRLAASRQIGLLIGAIADATQRNLESLIAATDRKWENSHQAVDEAGVVHVQNLRTEDALCGASLISSSFLDEPRRERCHICDALLREDKIEPPKTREQRAIRILARLLIENQEEPWSWSVAPDVRDGNRRSERTKWVLNEWAGTVDDDLAKAIRAEQARMKASR